MQVSETNMKDYNVNQRSVIKHTPAKHICPAPQHSTVGNSYCNNYLFPSCWFGFMYIWLQLCLHKILHGKKFQTSTNMPSQKSLVFALPSKSCHLKGSCRHDLPGNAKSTDKSLYYGMVGNKLMYCRWFQSYNIIDSKECPNDD